MQAYYTSLLSDELQKAFFQHVNDVLYETDVNYPFRTSNWLVIIITILDTIFVILLGGTIWYFKYGRLQAK